MLRYRATVAILLIGTTIALEVRAANTADDIVRSNDRVEVILSRQNGSILKIAPKGQQGSIFQSGEYGLWQARFDGGAILDAASFSTDSAERRFQSEYDAQANVLRLMYRSRAIDVTIEASFHNENVDFAANVTPKEKTLLEFAIPARLRFQPDQIDRIVCPTDGNGASGMSLRSSFFKPQEQWRPATVGGKGYADLLGGGPVMRPDNDSPVPVQVTEEGRKWLGAENAESLKSCKFVMVRPPQSGQYDLALVDSEYGPLFSSKKLGDGRVWRLGGLCCDGAQYVMNGMVANVLTRLAENRPSARGKIGIIFLPHGPAYGGFVNIAVSDWAEGLRKLPFVQSEKSPFVVLETIDQLTAAEKADDFMAIVNPYGEWLPVAKPGDMAAAVARIEQYVRRGGHWFETGGFPFYAELLPTKGALQYECSYPPTFADFFHFQTTAGAAALFRVQPRNWAPWDGENNHQSIFVPGRIAVGGDNRGGWCDRPFATHVKANVSWQCPVVRLKVGDSPRASIAAYAEANGIVRRLEDKMSREVFEKFKRSVLVYYGGPCRELFENLALLPIPTQIHTADYLYGGFDKQYPDHLPPQSDFGSPEEFRRFIDRAHVLGHLVIPYTNPTWWCDKPKGPTFERFGEAPLLKTLDGKVSPERYAQNTGFTVCHWHPAVQEANRRTVRQFCEDYPVDILFQDQCGARGWRYDVNPASPTPWAYAEGLLSMIDEDCRQVPLSTESGWDRVVNAESQLCGMTFEIMPSDGRPLLKNRFDPVTWEIFPLAQYLAHDKTAMIHHDLGQFVDNQERLAWTLGLGYAMSYRVHAPALRDIAVRQWLLWLDRLQKSVCARYFAKPLDEFSHRWATNSSTHENGILRARYGDLRVTANLNSQPSREDNRELAGYGFQVSAPGLVAAHLNTLAGHRFGKNGVSFVAEKTAQRAEIWIYARPNEDVAVLLPTPASGPHKFLFDGGYEIQGTVQDDVHLVRLPSRLPTDEKPNIDIRYLWHAVTIRN